MWALGNKQMLFVALAILGLFLLSKFRCGDGHDGQVADKYKQIADQAKYWYAASKQDSNILMALVHVNTALVKLHTLGMMLTSTEANRQLQTDTQVLYQVVKEYQQKVLEGFREHAPSIAFPSGTAIDIDWYV